MGREKGKASGIEGKVERAVASRECAALSKATRFQEIKVMNGS